MKTSKTYVVALDAEYFGIEDVNLLNQSVFVGYQALVDCMNDLGRPDYWRIYDINSLVRELSVGKNNLQATNWFAAVTVIEEDEI